MKQQILVLRTSGARGIFIPGNHDWDQFGSGGWERVREEERYIESLATHGTEVRMLPGGGCPGPVTVDLGRRGRLVLLDTQWWLDAGPKPGPGDNPTACRHLTQDEIVAGTETALAEATAANRWTIVAGHHPIRSRGPHGGYVDPRWHLFPLLMLDSYVPIWLRWFPLPGIGTAMGLARRCCSPSPQDFANATNRRLRRRLRTVLTDTGHARRAPLLYAAGHEHSLQVFRGMNGAGVELVSGRGSSSKASPVGHDAATLFAHADPAVPGFACVDLLRDGRVRLSVVEILPASEQRHEAFSRWLP